MSNGLKDEKKDLPFEGLSSRPGMPADLGSVNIDALAFLPNIPAKYRALMPFLAARQNELTQKHQQEKRDRAEQISEFASQISAATQREIDSHVLKFSVDGVDIEMSQGELRKSMERRVDVLKDRIKTLRRSGENPEELHRMENLVQAYGPAIEKAKKGGDDEGTINAAKDLMRQDPEWASSIKNHAHKNSTDADAVNDRRTSYSGANFDAGAIAGPSLKDSFSKGASPDAPQQQQTSAAPPEPEKRQQVASNNFQSLNF